MIAQDHPRTLRPVACPNLGGRDSVIWKINREIVVLAGWSSAILMQIAHPLVLAGVVDHSVFVADPSRRLERLKSTIESMLLLTFGTPEQVLRTADKINAIHDRVHGHLEQGAGIFAAHTYYTAHDPELLRWVHATLIDTLPRAYELMVGPLSDAEKDAYCLEASTLAPLLGIPDGFLPTSMAALHSYIYRTYKSGIIQVTDRARELANDILHPPLPGPAVPRLAAAPLLPAIHWANALPTIALLPPFIRHAYGLRWTPLQEAALRGAAAASRRVLPHVPSLMRHWPASRR